ncbi:prolyl oligopeptidase family serine peptidase [Aquimarina litoralis]
MKLKPKVVVDTIHGQLIQDPYRYLENSNSEEVKNWIFEQNDIANSFLNSITKKDYLIKKQIELDKLDQFEISSIKLTSNNQLFYLKRLPEENTSKLFYKKDINAEEQLLLDPSELNLNGKNIISYIQPDWIGSKVVVAVTEKGREVSDILIINVTTKKIHNEIISNTWPSNSGGVEWLPDNSGFLYLHYPTIDIKSKEFLKNTKSVLYKIGEGVENNKEVFSKNVATYLDLDENDFPIVSLLNKNDKYLIGKTPGAGSYYNAYYTNMEEINNPKWKPLFNKENEIKSYLIIGDSLIYKTSKNSSNYKICKTSIENPNFENPKVLIPEHEEYIINDFEVNKDGVFFVRTKNGVSAKLFNYSFQTKKETEIELPKKYGNLSLKSSGLESDRLWIEASGWTTKNDTYLFQKNTLTTQNINQKTGPNTNDLLKDIVVEEIEVDGHDGSKIPLSIFYKKDIFKNKPAPLLMDGYGAYGISMKPQMSSRRTLWVLEGGIYAVAHVRGGGEKGVKWHTGGNKRNKANTWKDFISCAEYLVDQKYTSKEQLAILSGSAGGIMIGRAITEKPELFKAAIIEFGSLNMMRSEMRPNGVNNTKEFGTIKNKDDFEALKEMDAYHHIKKNTSYPSLFLTAGLNDPRVPSWFTLKFMAKMKLYDISKNPKLVLIDSTTGHGKDVGKMKQYQRYANLLLFAFNQTGHENYIQK